MEILSNHMIQSSEPEESIEGGIFSGREGYEPEPIFIGLDLAEGEDCSVEWYPPYNPFP